MFWVRSDRPNLIKFYRRRLISAVAVLNISTVLELKESPNVELTVISVYMKKKIVHNEKAC